MANKTDKDFQEAMAMCREIFKKKLYDYKPSWRMLRPESLTDQLFIKAKRIRTLEITKESHVGEGILPEFMALINYGLIGLIQLEKGFADKVDMTNDKAMAEYDRWAKECTELMLKKNHDYESKPAINISILTMKSTRIIIINLFRIVLGLTFILSGFVKAIDPLGTQYKIEDYLGVLSLGGMLPDFVTLGTSVAISAIEFTLGVLLLFAISRRVISKVTLVFMTIMTLITAWLYIANPISDCGCFGDAIHLTNGETLLKNVIMLVMTAVVVYKPRDMIRTLSNGNSTIVINYSVLFILLYAAYSLYMLPQFDFRPYHIGTNIEEGMKILEGAPQPEFETTFLMKKDGQTKEFTLENYPDSTWEFVDSKTIMIKEGFVPPIHDFSILSLNGDDLTEDILQQKGYTFLLIAPSNRPDI